jgi:hypothetical protein
VLHAEFVADLRADIAARRHKARVSETIHQCSPRACDARYVPARGGWLAGESVARQRWNHEMKGVQCARLMRRGIGQWINDLELLDDRARPSMRDNERQCIFVPGANVDEMYV